MPRNNHPLFLVISSTLLFIFSCDEKAEDPRPLVQIVSPVNGTQIVGVKEFVVEASDDDEIQKVEILVDNVFLGIDDAVPYTFTLDLTDYPFGLHTVKAIATDTKGSTASHEIVIEVTAELDRPIDLSVSKGEFNNKIALAWSHVPGALNYEVYRKLPSESDYHKIGSTAENSLTDTDIPEPLVQIFYKVRVYNTEFAYSEFTDVDYGYTTIEKYNLIRSFGEEGTSPHQFGFAPLISIDQFGILYISDGSQSNIKKYTVNGEYIDLFKSGVDSQAPLFVGEAVVTSNGYNLVIEKNGMLIADIPTGMNIVGQAGSDDEGNIYIAVNYNAAEEYNHHRIYKYDQQGNPLTSFGTKGMGVGQLNEPWGVSFINNHIVVTSQANKKAQFFTKDGVFVKEFDFSNIANILYGNFVKDGYLYIAAGEFIIKTDFEGAIVEKIGSGILTKATSVVVDDAGNIIVSEPYERKIRVFDSE
jgi:hypothetical protein